MKKKVIIGIIIAGVIAIGAATAAIVVSKNNTQPAEPKDIAVITMPAIAGTPYFWSYEVKTPDIVELVDEQTVEESSDLVGAPFKIVYKFKGINPGETEIVYDYASAADGYVSERVTYRVVVAEDLTTTPEIVSHDYDIDPNAEDSTTQTPDIEPGIEE